MKALSILIVILLTALGYGSVRNDIDHQYKKWSKAAISNDVETILAVLAPDYTLKTFTGKVIARKDYEASLRKRKQSKAAAVAYKTQMAGCNVLGKVADVISDETSETPSVDPITSKKLKIIHIHRYQDRWVKIGQVWRLQTTVTTVESTKVFPVG